jgi:hypothetical protein
MARPAALADGMPVVYVGEPRVPFPVPPLQVFGLKYALDVVLVSDHPDWAMHEYARIDLPNGSLWVAKDAGADREQTLTASIPGLERWLPEVPVRRVPGTLAVDDRSHDDLLDVRFDYVNPKGQPTHVEYVGALPTAPSSPRNGNTMGHSRQVVAALLDLYAFRVGGAARITIDGEERGFHRLLGVQPEIYLLGQVQGGFAITDFALSKGDVRGFVLRRPGTTASWPTRSERLWEATADGWLGEQDWTVAGTRYHFVDGELDRAQVVQKGEADPIVEVAFSPRVPDVRRTFSGLAVSRFVVDIHGQPGSGKGRVTVEWNGDRVAVSLLPESPAWFADRPMDGEVSYAGEEVYVRVDRSTQPVPSPE